MNAIRLILLSAISMLLASCMDTENPIPDSERESEFITGADISWVTKMEKENMKFYNSSGEETECTKLMQEIGFDAIRLRVWVNPSDGWCDKDDVLKKANRAQKLGMDIMIDFHYSDSWADPGKQTPPEQWASFSEEEMTAAVASHTTAVLQALKDNAIDVRWIQIGNEVNQGMLWPSGKVNGNSTGSFVKYLNAGYDAAKSIYPNSKIILHLSNGHDSELYSWFFGLMASNEARYDIIGMSLYPIWWENGGWTSWKTNIDKCISNIRSVTSSFSKPVMICETGAPVHEPQMSKNAMQYLIDEIYKIEECMGVFYWEPEAPKGYNSGYEMGAFSNGRPTIALDPFNK